MTNPDPATDPFPETPSAVMDRLRQAAVLAELPDDVLRTMSAAARIERFALPTLLNAAGHPLERLRLVVQGGVDIIARRAAGQEVVLGDIGPGGWATWVGCFAPQPPDHDFYSTTEAVYISLPVTQVREVALAHPAMFPRVIADLGIRMRQLMAWTGDSVLLGPEQRMAKLIQLLARIQGERNESGSCIIRVTQQRLAQLARCSRQSANTLVGGLERRGLVLVKYGSVEIPDRQQLDAFIDQELDDA